MTQVRVTFDRSLLKRIDREAKSRGLPRSAYLAQRAERELGPFERRTQKPTEAELEARRAALKHLDELFARNPTWGDTTELIREDRDSH